MPTRNNQTRRDLLGEGSAGQWGRSSTARGRRFQGPERGSWLRLEYGPGCATSATTTNVTGDLPPAALAGSVGTGPYEGGGAGHRDSDRPSGVVLLTGGRWAHRASMAAAAAPTCGTVHVLHADAVRDCAGMATSTLNGTAGRRDGYVFAFTNPAEGRQVGATAARARS